MFNVLIVLEQEIGTFIYIFLIILLVKLVEKIILNEFFCSSKNIFSASKTSKALTYYEFY